MALTDLELLQVIIDISGYEIELVLVNIHYVNLYMEA